MQIQHVYEWIHELCVAVHSISVCYHTNPAMDSNSYISI